MPVGVSTSRTGSIAEARWSASIIALHWLTALLVAAAFALAIGHEFVEEKTARQAMMQWHRYAGLCAFLLTLVRIPLRFTTAKPDHGFTMPVRAASAAGHGFLYLGLLALPLLGYAQTSARTGKVDLFGLPLPALLERDRDLAETIQGYHSTLGWILLALIGLHAAMAIWHHRIIKDRVLTAMLPSR